MTSVDTLTTLPSLAFCTSVLLKSDRTTLVFEAVGDDKVRVTCQSWEDSRVILAEEALQVVALGKILHVCRVLRLPNTLTSSCPGSKRLATGR